MLSRSGTASKLLLGVAGRCQPLWRKLPSYGDDKAARPSCKRANCSENSGAKRNHSNGTTHVVFEPLDFVAKLAALVPRPRVNLTRYHGVFAPNSAHRAPVTKAGRGKGGAELANANARTPAERHSAMTWAQRLKRVFGIDIETCAACGGTLRIIACIEDAAVIKAILAHLADKARPVHAARLPLGRAPPAPVLG